MVMVIIRSGTEFNCDKGDILYNEIYIHHLFPGQKVTRDPLALPERGETRPRLRIHSKMFSLSLFRQVLSQTLQTIYRVRLQ